MITIETKIEREGCQPYRANEHDAGADLISTQEYIIRPGEIVTVKTGVAVHIPEGYVGLVFSRSGHGKRGIKLSNSVGVIDSGYQGEIMVMLQNDGTLPYVVAVNERVAQMVLVKCEYPRFMIVNEFSKETERGVGGFGSTGK